MPNNGTVESHGGFIPSFLRNLCTARHSGSNNLHSHQPCKRAPFSAYALQDLLFVDFLMMAILTYLNNILKNKETEDSKACCQVLPNSPA